MLSEAIILRQSLATYIYIYPLNLYIHQLLKNILYGFEKNKTENRSLIINIKNNR